jgi:hypothetical protein
VLESVLELKPEDRAARIDRAWENLTQTEDGQIVLASLLEELGLLDEIKGPEGIARHNTAVMILARIKRNSTRRIIAALVTREGKT